MGYTAYTSKKLQDHINGISAFAMPAGIWAGLHTASPTFDGSSAHEVPLAGTGYARMPLTGLMSPVDSATGITLLLGTITSPVALTDWGTITHFAIYDAAIAGNMLSFAELSEAQTIYAGGQFQRVPGQVRMKLY